MVCIRLGDERNLEASKAKPKFKSSTERTEFTENFRLNLRVLGVLRG